MKIVPITRKKVLCDGCESPKATVRFFYNNSRDFIDYCEKCHAEAQGAFIKTEGVTNDVKLRRVQ